MHKRIVAILVLSLWAQAASAACAPQACYVLEIATRSCEGPTPSGPPPLGGPRANHIELKVQVKSAAPAPCYPGDDAREPANGELSRIMAIGTAYYEAPITGACEWFLSNTAKLFLPHMCCDSPAPSGACALPGPTLLNLPPQASQ